MLHVDQVSLEFLNRKILEAVELRLSPGQIVGLVGPNGAGKTTLMRVIMGLISPQRGYVYISGTPVDRQSRVQIAYVPDEAFFYDDLSGSEFLHFTLELIYHHRVKQLPKEIASLAQQLRIEEVLDQRIYSYSLGTKRKLAILLALVKQPKYLILDEPFNGLDPESVRHIKKFLRIFAGSGCGVLVSTHQLDLMETLATHVTLLHQGHVVAVGDMASYVSGNYTSLESAFLSIIDREVKAEA